MHRQLQGPYSILHMRAVAGLSDPHAAFYVLAGAGLFPANLAEAPGVQHALQSLAPQWPAPGAGIDDLAAALRSTCRSVAPGGSPTLFRS